MTDIDQAAKIIWKYMRMEQTPRKCDAVFILGNRDDRTASYGAKLFLDGYGEYLIISGGNAPHNSTLQNRWPEPTETAHFAAIARRMGVPTDKLILEDRAISTGDNITLVHRLLQQKSLKPNSLLLVTKPYMERRVYATFKKQWPGASMDFVVTSPPIGYDDYFDGHSPKDEIINVMVGDLQRIKEYPKLGYQIEQLIPTEVWQAWKFLVSQGYTARLLE